MKNNATAPRNVTVIGLGLMGSALAEALLNAGHQVTVWNRTPAKAEPMSAKSAHVASSVSDAILASDVILVAREAIDGEVPRLGMGEVEPADAGRGRHGERLGQVNTGERFGVEQIEQCPLLRVIGARRISWRRTDALVVLAYQLVVAQRFSAGIAP